LLGVKFSYKESTVYNCCRNIGRDGFRERGALGHLSFGGPKQVWPIWPFFWKAWKYAPLMQWRTQKIFMGGVHSVTNGGHL